MNQTRDPIHFFRNTAIGGLLFLLPLVVIGALIGQVAPIVMSWSPAAMTVSVPAPPSSVSLSGPAVS